MTLRRLLLLSLFALLSFGADRLCADDEPPLDEAGCRKLHEVTREYQLNNKWVRESNSTWSCNGALIFVDDVQVTMLDQTPASDYWTRDQYSDVERGHRTGSWEGTGTGPLGTRPWIYPWDPWTNTTLQEDTGDGCMNCGG